MKNKIAAHLSANIFDQLIIMGIHIILIKVGKLGKHIDTQKLRI